MRKEIDITITDKNRDNGKVFHIQEMPSVQVEKWAIRAFLALSKSGADVPEDVAEAGIAGLMAFGLRGLSILKFEDAEPLLDEMMTCVTIKPDNRNTGVVRDLNDDDIEELTTRVRLRAEVVKLHTGFSTPGGLSNVR